MGWLNIVELAALVNVNVATVKRWRRQGKIPPADLLDNGMRCWSPEQIQDVLNWRSRAPHRNS
jgi:DNA-binding transcriptional MerR regulator